MLLLGLEAAAVGGGRLTQVLGAVAGEITQRREIHHVGYLRERQPFVVEQLFQDGDGETVHIGTNGVTRHSLDGGRQIFRRHIQPLGVVTHVALGAGYPRGEQLHELFHDVGGAVAMRIDGLALGMWLKDVINHRQAEAAHEFVVEQQVAVAHPVAKAVKVVEQTLRLLAGERHHGVPIQRDAAADAVIVRRQQILQELIVGGKPLHPQVGMSGKVLDAVRHRHHHEVVSHYVITPLVEHETALARQTYQVHAGVAQFRCVYRLVIVGILEIYLHGVAICRKFIQ